jgi:hypothetical protein
MDQENVVLVHNGILLARKKNEILSFTGKWTELENIILSKVSQAQRPKIVCSPSYADFRSRANAAM